MTAGPIDSELKLAQCPRCEAYVFAATSSGVKVAADPAPVSRDGYVAALAAGRRVFALLTVAGRPYKLLGRPQGTPPPSFDPQGLQDGSQRPVLAEHGCGAHGMDAARVEVVELPPPRRHAMHGKPKGGVLPPAAPGATATTSGPVGRANHHRFDIPPPNCGVCKSRISPGDSYYGIQHGQSWLHAVHEECP